MWRFLTVAPLVVSCLTLLLTLWMNRHTPFRGEHWAMLYAYVNAPEWLQGLTHVSQFECFANVRFQPLTFFVPLIPYLLFQENFFWHYLGSAALQMGYVFSILLLIHTLAPSLPDDKVPPRRWLGRVIQLYAKYPLEAAFLLVLYFGADIMTWSMYSYLQLATILVYISIAQYFRDRQYRAMVLISVATLIYEPAWVVGVLFVVFALPNIRQHWKSVILGGGVSLAFAGIFYQRYHQHIDGVLQTSSGKNSLLVSLPHFEKVILLFIKWLYALAVSFSYFIFPLSTERGTIFELKVSSLIQNLNPFLLCAIVLIAFLLTAKNRGMLFLWATIFGLFAMIAWARTDGTPYVLRQFRYAYLLAGPLFVLGYKALDRFRNSRPQLYRLGLSVLCLIQINATLRHGMQVRDSMEPLAKWVAAVPEETGKQTVNRVVNALVEGSVVTSKELEPFIYNARSCLVQWKLWMNRP